MVGPWGYTDLMGERVTVPKVNGETYAADGVQPQAHQSRRVSNTNELAKPIWRRRVLLWLFVIPLVAAYVAVMLTGPNSIAHLGMLEVIYCIPVVASVVLSGVAVARSEGAERVFWASLGAANFFLLACEVLLVAWVMFIDPKGPPRVSWPFHILHAFAALSFLTLVLSMTRMRDADSIAKFRFYTDFTIGGVLVYVAMLVLYARPVMSRVRASEGDILLGAGYALAAILLLVGTLINVTGLKVVKWRSWEKLVAFSLPVYAVGVAAWPWWYTTVTATSRNLSRGWLDVIQMVGHWVLAMAVIYRLTEPMQSNLRPLPPVNTLKRRWLAALPAGMAVASLPFIGYAAFTQRSSVAWFTVYGGLGVLLAALVLGRSAIVSLEHSTLFHRSVTDPLTGMYNHRFFHTRLAEEIERARRWGDNVALIMMDVDDFGVLNERLGHMEGDRVLAGLGAKIKENISPNDVAARYGGDEFAVIVPEMDGRAATVLAQRLLDVLGIEGGSRPGALTVSAGVASYPADATAPDDLIRLADGALFRAKELGKDRTVLYEPGRVPDLSARERIEHLEQQSRLASVRALAAAVDARDSATLDHSAKVASLARRVCDEMGFDDEHANRVELAAVVHDVGKIGLPDGPLLKPGPLTAAEWREVREHPALGQQILAATQLNDLLPWVRGHHERWDGKGYPDGLAGEEIPLEARILSACDAFDAMTSTRRYRDARPQAEALDELRVNAGKQFDARVVDALIKVVERDPAN
jgi:diguanylate cyclase (GGDEF)-like protein